MTATPVFTESAFQTERFAGTWDEFWAFLAQSEANQDYDYEWEDGFILRTMSHEPPIHSTVASRLSFIFETIFDGLEFEVFNANRPVFVPALNHVRNPDGMVVKKPFERYEYRPGMTAEMTPMVLAEVISPSSRRQDFKKKLPAYQQIPSVQSILFVELDFPMVHFYTRLADGSWGVAVLDKLSDSFELHGRKISLHDIYKRVVFED